MFFVAPDDATAAGVADRGPGPAFASATYGNFDVWSTLEELENVLTGRDPAEGGPEVVSGDDEPLVLGVPAALTTALAQAGRETLASAAERWVALRADDGEDVDVELAYEIVGELAALSATAERSGQSLYCWIC